jgi:hypothetical protein
VDKERHDAEVLSYTELADFFTLLICFFDKFFLVNSTDSIKKYFYSFFAFEKQIRQGF